MFNTIRKGAVVRYIGSDENAKGMLFTVRKKSYNSIMVSFPVKYLNGDIHYERTYKSISEFELVK